MQYFTFHSFPAAPCLPPPQHPPSPCSHLFCIYSASLFCIFSFISVLSSYLFFFIYKTLSYFSPGSSTRPLLPLHIFSSANTTQSIPASIALLLISPSVCSCSCCVSFLSASLYQSFAASPLPVSLPPMLTLPLAECSVSNRHLGRRISVSPLACWDRFSKNTAKGYLTAYACGSASVHKHTRSLSLPFPSVCLCV